MKEGMLFIWTEKELIAQIIRHFEGQGFTYVENMVYVMLDKSKKDGKYSSARLTINPQVSSSIPTRMPRLPLSVSLTSSYASPIRHS